MKILIVGSFNYSIHAPAYAYGFRKLGHEVVELDYERYQLKGKNLFSSLHNRIQRRFHIGLLMNKYNNAIIKEVEKGKPDFVLLYRCYHIYDYTLKAIKNKTVLLSYNNDDPFSEVPSKGFFRYHKRNAKYCDINYVYRPKNITDYAQQGISNTKILLPHYFSKQIFPKKCEKDIPISFIGHFENDGRDILIKKLIDAGIPIRIYGGKLWAKSLLFQDLQPYLYPPIYGDEYNEIINRSRILLVLFSKINSDTYTRRCFEIPATKSLMLSEYSYDMDRLYPENECAVYFKNAEELIEIWFAFRERWREEEVPGTGCRQGY